MSGGATFPRENIILIGFMGSGKSSIARDLSTALGYPVVDTDSLVVEQAGKPIPAIFESMVRKNSETVRLLFLPNWNNLTQATGLSPPVAALSNAQPTAIS